VTGRRLLALIGLGLALWLGGAGLALAQPSQLLVLLRMSPTHFRSDTGYGGGYGDGPSRAARLRTAERLARAHGLKLNTSWPMPVLGLDCYVMDVPAGRSSDQAAAELSRDPAVEWSESMHTYRGEAQGLQGGSGPAAIPNDPLFRFQPAAEAWRLADLQKAATGRGVRVAVVDSRIDAAHPDLAGQIQTSRDFIPEHAGGPEQHGTAVAGVIAAREGNGLGIAGVAPGARLMALRACWQGAGGAGETSCDTLSLAKAISFGIENGAQVYNLSFAGPADRLLGRLIDAAMARGAVVVGAVDPAMAQGGFPASHPGVIAVFSDPVSAALPIKAYGAPGRDVPTTLPGGRWSTVNGSSYAAAHVSGLFALLRERNARGGASSMLVTIRANGAIDPCASLRRALGDCEACACPGAGKALTAAR
jgi:subtilisin family serine protease